MRANCSDRHLRNLYERRFMTIQEAADYIGVSTRTIQRRVQEGLIHSPRRGVVSRLDVRRFAPED